MEMHHLRAAGADQTSSTAGAEPHLNAPPFLAPLQRHCALVPCRQPSCLQTSFARGLQGKAHFCGFLLWEEPCSAPLHASPSLLPQAGSLSEGSGEGPTQPQLSWAL